MTADGEPGRGERSSGTGRRRPARTPLLESGRPTAGEGADGGHGEAGGRMRRRGGRRRPTGWRRRWVRWPTRESAAGAVDDRLGPEPVEAEGGARRARGRSSGGRGGRAGSEEQRGGGEEKRHGGAGRPEEGGAQEGGSNGGTRGWPAGAVAPPNMQKFV